ncbi:hypothetical protein [Methyloversatilis discipulorum]|uniref:hypothetical protein n=1 Tax=Methyloversatilis discipulorum TaxID=1119528 RepID=UPI00036FC905|nr:hypothetical protein [Methyloversatilis discipulorum]
MPTETRELPDDPKARVAATAKPARDTTDAFAHDANAEKTCPAEQEASAVNVAKDRYARILASGETIPWQELRRYLIAHIAGMALPLPAPRRPVL